MRRVIAMLCLSASLGNGAPAQTPPPEPQGAPEIVVTARKPPTAEQARTYARQVSARVDGQLARLDGAACPRAIGFPADIARQIEARIRAVATDAGIAVGTADCRGNLVVFGVDDGAALVRGLSDAQSPLIRRLAPAELRRLMQAPGPARAWSQVEMQNEDGLPGLTPVGALWPNLDVRGASHIRLPTRQAIRMSVVVLEWPALLGKTVTQIADYAAMRTLARTRPDAAPGDVGTILSLFAEGAAAPGTLTAADRGYLHALYRQSAMLPSRQQVRDIARTVERGGR